MSPARRGTSKRERRTGPATGQEQGPSRHLAPEGVLATRVLAVVGLVVAGVGVATALVLEDWSGKPARILLGVAIFLVVLFFLTNWRWLVHLVVTKKALISLNVLVMILVAAAILCMVNYVSYRHFWRKDYSQSQLYELSGQTENILRNLKQPVAITVFYEPTMAGIEFADYLRRLLAEYTFASDRITTEFVRLDEDPKKVRDLVKKYEVSVANSVVLAADEQRKNVPSTEIILYQGGMFGEAGRTTYAGEPALTAALRAVTETRQKKVYFVTGHKERSPTEYGKLGYSSAARELRGANYEVPDPINLLAAGDVPQDCDLLIVPGPQQPFAPEEVEALTRYLEAGKPAFFLLDPEDADYQFVKFGFEPLLESRNVTVTDALALDPDSCYQRFASCPVPPTVASYHDITREMKGSTMVFQYARPLESKSGQGGYAATDLLRTSAKSWGETTLQTEDRGRPTGGGANLLEDATKHWRPKQWVGAQLILATDLPEEGITESQAATVIASRDTTLTIAGKFRQAPDGKKEQVYALAKPMGPDEDQDPKGPLALAVASSRRSGGGPMSDTPAVETDRLVVVGDSDFAGNSSVDTVPGNRDFFLNCVSWLVGKVEEIGIRPKNPELANLQLSARQMKGVIWVVLVAMPAGVILAGCVVWWLRRLG